MKQYLKTDTKPAVLRFSINEATKCKSVHEPMMDDMVNEEFSVPLVIIHINAPGSMSLQFNTLKA